MQSFGYRHGSPVLVLKAVLSNTTDTIVFSEGGEAVLYSNRQAFLGRLSTPASSLRALDFVKVLTFIWFGPLDWGVRETTRSILAVLGNLTDEFSVFRVNFVESGQ